ncbi:CDP-alcohol phosphatidyltransferase family protein [Leptospira gomenensis]|uniref:CDP-diacylglycerol--glycerol-3-phosphate 3-phosphatidyltransferase n=1 Tax=Leptospira gomenensis TaxID=2484974 RepID=A0A5F1YDS5_9LEPT|nr:CDP-alcohol phosphatidyltransferase family protein [Leptospira gomenensis]TGK35486.1 CDP-alcohol phosphatidyltransferase family protein [Leptospira gomenensis]TGK40622.1 CDP-alcohol phosphatidyltransferase family protein [Leptospira gomenensis]TGK46300.1 CDP-alcohol phosphatidyltransferase family protein [Leptospira gomenensis]TGK66435.1 CDP-alcohol phosphatidyltransferase family protein [Leptospira gomenensis]
MIVQEKKPKELLEDRIFTVSNFLSVSRVFLLPFFITFTKTYMENPERTEFLLYAILTCLGAVLTDYLDGFLARLLDQESVLGRYLDPVCDKIVTVGGLSVIVHYFRFPIWILIAYIIREILGIWLGSFLYLKRGIQGKPNWWGKFGVGLVAIVVLWYMCIPLIERNIVGESLLKKPELSGYVLVFILCIGIFAYSKRYWNIVFHPETIQIDPEDKKTKKKYELV